MPISLGGFLRKACPDFNFTEIIMDKRTRLEKTVGSIMYDYVGTALRAQLWMLCGLLFAFVAYARGYDLSSIGFIYIFVMMLTFGHFFSYLPTHLRKYGFTVKGRPRLWWVILERTLFPLFFLIFCDIIKIRFHQRYTIGQQWIKASKAAISNDQQKERDNARARLLKIKNWYVKRRDRQRSQEFVDGVKAIGRHMVQLDDYYRWDRDEDSLRDVFHTYQHALPSHKEIIEHHYRQTLTPFNDGKELPEINIKQPTLEGKLLYLAAVIRAEQDKHYNRLDFARSDFKAGRYVYTSNRSAIDMAYWSKKLPAINAYLGGEWEIAPLDGTSLVLYQLAELPPLIPFQTEFLQQNKIFFGFNVRTGERYYTDLDIMPHTLVVGKSGSGKSVFLNQVMASLLYNITHFEKIYLIDLKGGVELSKYEGLHSKIHLVDNYDDLLGIFQNIFTQMEDRLKQMKKNGDTLFNGPHLCIICDEFAQIAQYPALTKEEKQNKLQLQSYLNRISMLGRAAKCNLLIQLQKATVDNIEASFRNNLATKICFKVHSNSDAATVFGSTEDLPAISSLGGFKNLQKGRYILSDDISGENFYMQATMLDDGIPLARLLQTAGDARVVSEAQADERVSEAE